MRLFLISLGIAVFIGLLAIIGVAQVPITKWLSYADIPEQVQIAEPKGNAFSGTAKLTINSNEIVQKFDVEWGYCPAGLNGWFPSTLSMWCIDLVDDKINISTELSLFDENIEQQNYQGISISDATITMDDYGLEHPLYGNLKLTGIWDVEQLLVDFKQRGLHTIHQLQSSSKSMQVKVFDIEVDEGSLQLTKAINSNVVGRYTGDLLEADLLCFEDGKLHLDASALDASGPIYAIMSFYFDHNDEYKYRGRWY